MFFFQKQKARIEYQAKETERLRSERDTYKHAFETTATDRDRLHNLLEKALSADDKAETPPPPGGRTAPASDPNIIAYGPLWGRVANDYEEIAGDGEIEPSDFEAILRYGGFSQFSMYTDGQFLSQLVDWQITTLTELGLRLEELPHSFHESEAMPAYLRFKRTGRAVSADFLRLLASMRI